MVSNYDITLSFCLPETNTAIPLTPTVCITTKLGQSPHQTIPKILIPAKFRGAENHVDI